MTLKKYREDARETAMMPHLPYPRRTYSPAVPATTSGLDLQSQLEAILDSVWKAEADWRFDDRLDMALKTRGDNLNTHCAGRTLLLQPFGWLG